MRTWTKHKLLLKDVSFSDCNCFLFLGKNGKKRVQSVVLFVCVCAFVFSKQYAK